MENPSATIFFSWQSDSPGNTNANLIRRSIESACSLQIEQAMRLDEAAKGIAGTPDIPETIFRKIRECSVAIFDLTIVGLGIQPLSEIDPQSKRAFSNPNVLLELGYAAGVIGWERVITVFNSDGGHKPEELPFDLRHRRFPIVYDTSKGTGQAEKFLSAELSNRIEVCLKAPHEQARIIRSRLDHDVLVALDAIGLVDCVHHDSRVTVDSVRRMLDLGMIWSDQDQKQNLYAYHFTPVGELVREQLHYERYPEC